MGILSLTVFCLYVDAGWFRGGGVAGFGFQNQKRLFSGVRV